MFITKNKKMQNVNRMMNKAAGTSTAILLEGERGTGKSVCARMIHEASEVKGQFVKLSTNELKDIKGHLDREKIKEQMGVAVNGTLFIDDIQNLDLIQQTELHKIINRQGRPRLIAATITSLEMLVKKGAFMEDLYHLLCVSKIKLPPLRERKEDIAQIADEFITSYSPHTKGVSEEAINKLSARAWPGNIKELKSVLQYACHHTETGIITEADLPDWSLESYYRSSSGESLNDELERISGELMQAVSQGEAPCCLSEYLKLVYPPLLRAALTFTDHNKSRASQMLGINRNTFKKMLREYNIEEKNN